MIYDARTIAELLAKRNDQVAVATMQLDLLLGQFSGRTLLPDREVINGLLDLRNLLNG